MFQHKIKIIWSLFWRSS